MEELRLGRIQDAVFVFLHFLFGVLIHQNEDAGEDRSRNLMPHAGNRSGNGGFRVSGEVVRCKACGKARIPHEQGKESHDFDRNRAILCLAHVGDFSDYISSGIA